METDILCKADVAALGLVRAGVLFAALGGENHNQQFARYKSICTKVYGALSRGVRAPSGLNSFCP